MIPELPRAPSIAASTIDCIVSTELSFKLDFSMIEFINEAKFVPVSPSGTGKTLILFKLFFSEITFFAPMINELYKNELFNGIVCMYYPPKIIDYKLNMKV